MLPRLSTDNAQREFYLTDIIRLGYESGRNIGVSHGADPDEILGVNTPQDLARVEALMARRSSIKA
jgi:bifunctional UDP-N-acetylglucosamine pyrophosphorylase / glucosamine-1-phosphate N-acetyltransferase